MNYRLPLLLACLMLVAAVPAMAAGDYLGGDIQLGGSGTQITQLATTILPLTTGMVPVPAQATGGSLSVATKPPGATVFLDGVQRGISPVTISGIAPGGHTLLVKLDGYADLTAPVTVIAGQTQAYTTGLVPAATPLPSATKSPGFEPAFCIAAFGAVLAAGRFR